MDNGVLPKLTKLQNGFSWRKRVTMNLTASDIYAYYQPAECARRIYLRYRGEPEAEPGPYEQILRRLGERHERAHLASLGEVEDLSWVDFGKAVHTTRDLIHKGVPVIYQPAFRVETRLGSVWGSIGGVPDFLIRAGNSYLIRDCKISRRVNEVDHPEIIRQPILSTAGSTSRPRGGK